MFYNTHSTPTLLTKKPPSVLAHRNAVCSVFTAYTELKLCYIHTHTQYIHYIHIIYIIFFGLQEHFEDSWYCNFAAGRSVEGVPLYRYQA